MDLGEERAFITDRRGLGDGPHATDRESLTDGERGRQRDRSATADANTGDGVIDAIDERDLDHGDGIVAPHIEIGGRKYSERERVGTGDPGADVVVPIRGSGESHGRGGETE